MFRFHFLYNTGSAREAGAAADLSLLAEKKYASIGGQYHFAPITVVTLASMNTSSCQLFANLGKKISSTSGNEMEGAFLCQRVSELVHI